MVGVQEYKGNIKYNSYQYSLTLMNMIIRQFSRNCTLFSRKSLDWKSTSTWKRISFLYLRMSYPQNILGNVFLYYAESYFKRKKLVFNTWKTKVSLTERWLQSQLCVKNGLPLQTNWIALKQCVSFCSKVTKIGIYTHSEREFTANQAYLQEYVWSGMLVKLFIFFC